ILNFYLHGMQFTFSIKESHLHMAHTFLLPATIYVWLKFNGKSITDYSAFMKNVFKRRVQPNFPAYRFIGATNG
ncbi:hypothetical protein ACJX0J_010244, partial [Zea mays]